MNDSSPKDPCGQASRNSHLQLQGPCGSSAEVTCHGAQVLSWISGGRERLFMSPRAAMAPGKAIRGGVPVIFPQFAERGRGVRHGFARLEPWRVIDPNETDRTRAMLVLDDGERSRQSWPHRFHAELGVVLGERQLSISLQVTNTDDREFAFTAALHTYLRVDDTARVSVGGLEGRSYLDFARGGTRGIQTEGPLRFGGEIDRIYPGASGPVVLSDDAGSLRVESSGFADTVVWNPGAELASGMSDLGPNQHTYFVCIESAVVELPVCLVPGETWRASQTLIALN